MYEPMDFNELKGIDGLSDELLDIHFKLYKGYVENTNHILEHLENEDDEVRFAELKRRIGWEFNGMRLHELYFENLTKNPVEPDPASELHNHISAQFGSIERWKEDFQRIAAMRGIGWGVLYYDMRNDKLINVWIEEHNQNHLTTCKPILVVDFFEHAYMLDYKTDKIAYFENVYKSLDWRVAEDRLKVLL